MFRSLFLSLTFFTILSSCGSSDDVLEEACATREPVEVLQGEGRLSFSWQDITEAQLITEYEFQLVQRDQPPVGNFQGTGAPVRISSDPDRKFHIETVGSLPYNTEFDLYYRAVCENQVAETLGPIALRSLAFGEGCTPPADLMLIELTSTTASFTWEGFDDVQWRIGWGSNDGMDGGDADVSETNYTITDLRPGIPYLVSVKALCTDTEFNQSELQLNPSQTFTTLAE